MRGKNFKLLAGTLAMALVIGSLPANYASADVRVTKDTIALNRILM